MKITMTVRDFGFDFFKYSKAFEDFARVVVREAAREWLRVATNRMPTRTGFLRGSFGILDDMLGKGSNQDAYSKIKKLAGNINKLEALKKELEGNRQRLFEKTEAGRIEQSVIKAKRKIQGKKEKQKEEKISEKNKKRNRGRTYEEAAKDILKVKEIRLDNRIRDLEAKLTKYSKHLEKYKSSLSTKAGLLSLREAVKKKKGLSNPIVGYRYKGSIFKEAPVDASYKISLTGEGKKEIERLVKEAKLHKTILDRRLSTVDRRAKDKARRRLQVESFRGFVSGNKEKFFKREEVKTVRKGVTPVHAFREYYYHTKGAKTLKTPYSGRQFVQPTDEKNVFLEAKSKDAQDLRSTAQQTFEKGREYETFGKLDEESTVSDEKLKSITSDPRIANFINKVTQKAKDKQTIFRFRLSNFIRYYLSVRGWDGRSQLMRANQTFINYVQRKLSKAPRLTDYIINNSCQFGGLSVPALEEIVKVRL
jgi:hypothetical protein